MVHKRQFRLRSKKKSDNDDDDIIIMINMRICNNCCYFYLNS